MTKTVNGKWDSELARLSTYGAQEIVNGKCEMKSYLKSEIARAAGMSYSTFSRWLSQNTSFLAELGVMPTAKLIPARAAQWICGQYGIDEGEL